MGEAEHPPQPPGEAEKPWYYSRPNPLTVIGNVAWAGLGVQRVVSYFFIDHRPLDLALGCAWLSVVTFYAYLCLRTRTYLRIDPPIERPPGYTPRRATTDPLNSRKHPRS